jgi:hypothetical protein
MQAYLVMSRFVFLQRGGKRALNAGPDQANQQFLHFPLAEQFAS